MPARGLDGEPTLEVDETGRVAPPTSIPLTMVANLRSAYNKVQNVKQTLQTLGLDMFIASETWERPHRDLTKLLECQGYSILSYCRGRETPASRLDGKKYPGKTGGGAAIIYNHETFEAVDTEIGVPAGIEATWAVFAPRRLEEQLSHVKRICIGSIYIAPRSPYKKETVDHIIHTIHMIRAKYNNQVHFLMAGDFNRVEVTEILDSYGALHQVCGVATRQGAALQLVLTDLHTLLHPATALPPIQVDEDKQGKDGDHQALILAPKASKAFMVKREKKAVKTRPMPASRVAAFCSDLTKHEWSEVKLNDNTDEKVEEFHRVLKEKLEKHLPERTVTMTNLDKEWMTPELKQLLRQVQRERMKQGKSLKYKQLRRKFRCIKRKKIKYNTENVVNELKIVAPGKWHQAMKKMGGEHQSARRLEVQNLKGLSDQEAAEVVAESFAAVSLEYEKLDRSKLPTISNVENPEEVNVFQVLHEIKKLKKTRSTLPIDIPDSLRKECALDLAEPLTDIINSCLRAGKFPTPWRREWVTPVPKTAPHQPGSCKDLRKIASTSDYSKLFEVFLRKWIVEDIDKKININQFSGRKGMGTEHLIVLMMDRVLKLLDTPGKTAVIMAAVDWKGAFDRLDPTVAVTKLINLGVRHSIIPIIIQYLEDRQMTVRYNTAWSKWHKLVGGAPQGSWMGQMSYIAASDDAASWVEDEDKYKYCDDLSILELIMVGDLLQEYDFTNHVASDVEVGQRFIQPSNLKTQQNLNQIAEWTTTNKMRLNEEKTKYLIFSRTMNSVATRLTVNEKVIDKVKYFKLLGVWLQEDGGWAKNTQEICRRAYSKVSMLTKLKYAGVSTEDLLLLYKLHVRTSLEYCAAAFHSSLSISQAASLERCQSVSLKIILQESYISYEAALEMTGLVKLKTRREERCKNFSLKCIKHESNKRFFPLNQNDGAQIRTREKFVVNFARTNAYKNSTIPYCQRLLNQLTHEEEEERRRGEGEE